MRFSSMLSSLAFSHKYYVHSSTWLRINSLPALLSIQTHSIQVIWMYVTSCMISCIYHLIYCYGVFAFLFRVYCHVHYWLSGKCYVTSIRKTVGNILLSAVEGWIARNTMCIHIWAQVRTEGGFQKPHWILHTNQNIKKLKLKVFIILICHGAEHLFKFLP